MDLECEGKMGVGLPELTWIHTHKTAALLKVRDVTNLGLPPLGHHSQSTHALSL
jgi:hypothetical protein